MAGQKPGQCQVSAKCAITFQRGTAGSYDWGLGGMSRSRINQPDSDMDPNTPVFKYFRRMSDMHILHC